MNHVVFELLDRHFVLVHYPNRRRLLYSREVEWSEDDLRAFAGFVAADVALAYAHRALDRVTR